MLHFIDGFAGDDRPALIAESGAIVSYGQLAVRADEQAARLGDRRRLVLLEMANDIASVVALLACLRGRHPVILATAATRARAIAAFSPEVAIAGDETLVLDAPPADLHPDLALLMSTSGSTGATRLVRLSLAAVEANAQSIAAYLGLRDSDRALTTLPLNYSYGLSVLTSHLAAGAATVLTDRSVIDPAFAALAERQAITHLAGVPYTYELFETSGFRDRPPSRLRILTQAGGRLPPETQALYAAWARGRGIAFYTMYGQTEATARIAYLPPELAESHPGSIGRAIPGGSLRIIDAVGATAAPGVTGEIAYSGPNVMMGYAHDRADLARGPEVVELRTGDLGMQAADGIFRVTGRISRISKVFGLRVDLDDLTDGLAKHGIAATVAADDRLIAVGVPTDQLAPAGAWLLAGSLPRQAWELVEINSVPRLPSGKTDFPSILAAGHAARAAATVGDSGNGSVAAAFARALRRPVTDADSFASLGGDSLSYIDVSMTIEDFLGELPEHWETMTIGEIAARAARRSVSERRKTRWVATEMLLRPLAITTIIIGHSVPIDKNPAPGGALALLMLAGYNLARFQRPSLLAPGRWAIVGKFLLRFIVPYFLLMVVFAGFAAATNPGWRSFLLVSNYLLDPGRNTLVIYWFLEALTHCMIGVALLMSIPAVRHFASHDPWRFGLVFLGAGASLKLPWPSVVAADAVPLLQYRTDAWVYAFALGWLAADADTQMKKIACIGFGLLLAALDFGLDTHVIYLAGALTVILLLPRALLPAGIAAAAALTASATFYIYLVHGLVINVLHWRLHIDNLAVIVCASMAAGIAVMLGWRRLEALGARFAGTRSQPVPVPARG